MAAAMPVAFELHQERCEAVLRWAGEDTCPYVSS